MKKNACFLFFLYLAGTEYRFLALTQQVQQTNQQKSNPAKHSKINQKLNIVTWAQIHSNNVWTCFIYFL